MKEGLVTRVDRYLHRTDTRLARNIRAVSPREGLAYRKSNTKNIVERTVALPAALITTPLVGVLAAAVKVEDGGSSFYRSKRIGQDGEFFDLIKIRSLYEGADHDVLANNASANNPGNAYDSRSTRVGAWMRKRRLDELPQLWQVVSGRLALFGIRAMNSLSMEAMEAVRPQDTPQLYKDYFRTKPGAINPVTAFNDGGANLNKTYHYDAFYARRASLGMDLYMGFRTLARPFLHKKTHSSKVR
jgi:lipopolysaccharide/colanic/teichoic acid biosynthesis glycosyltransferase